MSRYSPVIQSLIDEFGRLPGIGPKSAQRIAFHLLQAPTQEAHRLAKAIETAKELVVFCDVCFNFSQSSRCEICSDDDRDKTIVCVVEDPKDVVAIERTSEFRGRYHVLQGAINPLAGIGPEQIRVKELLARVADEGITEIIMCTNPNIEGETTAMYIARLLEPLGVVVSRIASGLPVGGDLEYADEITLGRALENRRAVSSSK